MIFINACYIINAEHNYCISIKGLFEECYKEENVEVTGAATTSCSKTQLWNILSNVMYLQSLLGWLPSDK
jgi:hypothetical protein